MEFDAGVFGTVWELLEFQIGWHKIALITNLLTYFNDVQVWSFGLS